MTTVTRQIHFAVKGHRKRAVIGSPLEPGQDPASTPLASGGAPDAPVGRVPRVSRLVALAIRYDGLLRDGVVDNLTELAHLARVTQPRMTQIMNLLHLAPDIQEEVLFLPVVAEGRDPVTERHMRAITQVTDWSRQRAMWRKCLTTSST